MRARWTTIIAMAALGLLIALPAGAQEEESSDSSVPSFSANTMDLILAGVHVILHSYDADSMELLWATVTGDTEAAEEACDIVAGESYTYEVDDDGNVTLTADEGDDPQPSEECTFTATDVEGPEGQVNHGTVVSNFVHDLREGLREAGHTGGLGCFVRVIAQSDYGKESDEDGATEGTEEDPAAEFTITETTCGKPDHAGPEDAGRPDGVGKPDNVGNGKPDGVGNGRPDWAGEPGPPDHAKGGGRP